MSKILELAREVGIDDWWESGNEMREVLDEHLSRFYTLARADLEAEIQEQCRIIGIGSERELKLMTENAKLRFALTYIQAQTHVGHIHDTASAALGETK